MVIYENYGKNKKGVLLTRAYSDNSFYIEREEILYSEAIDPTELGRTYIETDIPIDDNTDNNETEAYAEAGRILMGVTE